MGDDLSFEERIAVRTPMQWNNSANAWFTTNDTAVRPVIDFGPFSYENVNVQDARDNLASLLNWTLQVVDFRKNKPDYGN